MSPQEVSELEEIVLASLESRDDSALLVLGYGEISVALGWPITSPRFVCKRTPPFNPAEFTHYSDLVTEYIAGIEARGLAVAETSIVRRDRGPQVISYLVQPMLDPASLGHNVLRAAEPDPNHPFLAALAETLGVVSSDLSIDAQVTNFSWSGSNLTLVDVGTPFLWDPAGRLRFDMKPFVRPLPALSRPLVARQMTRLVTRWNDPRRVGLDIVANLHREGLPEWVDATVVALNRHLSGDPVTAEEARQLYEEDVKIWPLLKKLQAVERWWQTSVRRRSYDWFIHSSFD